MKYFPLTRDSPQTMLVLTNIYMDMGARTSQFMTKIMFTCCCLLYCSQFMMVLHTIRLIRQIFKTNKLIISLLLLMCKHVSVLQIAQQVQKVQKKKQKKNFLVNNVRKLTAARELWQYFSTDTRLTI